MNIAHKSLKVKRAKSKTKDMSLLGQKTKSDFLDWDKMQNLILKLRDQGITVFLCSHLLEQVQEVCDQVGIIFRGKLIREGKLEDLIAIEDQTELVIRNANPELIARMKELIEGTDKAELVQTGKPRTTLERLFLKEIQRDES